jgi:hypothetical protein
MELQARADLRAGVPFGAWLFLLRASGAVQTVAIHDVSPVTDGDPAPAQEFARRLTVARDTLRSSNDPLAAAVLVEVGSSGTGDSPLSSPPRPDVLIIMVVTPNAGRVGFAPIIHQVDGATPARRVEPVLVYPLEWHAMAGPCAPMDGLFARDPAHALCAEDRRVLLP